MCLHQDRGQRMRQMDSLMPTLNDLYKRGRMTWTEQGKGWIGRPEEVLGALATDGFYECQRERAAIPIGRRPAARRRPGKSPSRRISSPSPSLQQLPHADIARKGPA